MAGGIGSRFWPASREERPKQFLDVLGTGKSLIRMTFERFLHFCPAERIFIVTNEAYCDLVLEHLPELTEDQIIREPSRKNTAPCIAYTAFKLQALDPEANLVVAPSDHVILQETNFVETVKKGLAFTEKYPALLTLGIQPTRPDTGYGYIEKGNVAAEDVHKVVSFREKPDVATAKSYLSAGNYVWNAGIFIWKVKHLLDAFKTHATAIYNTLGQTPTVFNTDEEEAFIREVYPTVPSISIDYAIMEKADNVFTIPSSFGWSDLGTWASLYDELDKDAQGNVVKADKTYLAETNNCLIRLPEGKLGVINGLYDFIVDDEGDILLNHPKSREQEIKAIIKVLGDM
ncbi:MAG: mannose-1-phosphate guanylyltransferase [Saprospiraceae bacterium]|nr:mannose-1-phosphate guanylyltransferase [Saprospiraceae bacterium]